MTRPAYIYKAALYCATCGQAIRGALLDSVAPYLRPVLQDSEDSDAWPQGPYPDGGGEADTPQHCDACGVFLENPLTADGLAYVFDALAADDGDRATLETWRAFYRDALGGALDRLDSLFGKASQ